MMLKPAQALAALLLAATLLLIVSSTASAHAKPQQYAPTPGSRLTTAPSDVQIWFSEPLEGSLSRFQVLDRAKNRVDAGQPAILSDNDYHATIALKPTLGPGTYTAMFRVVSAEDGHLTKGNFAFVVEGQPGVTVTPEPEPLVTATPDPYFAEPNIDFSGVGGPPADGSSPQASYGENPPSPFDIAARWFSFILAAMLVGGAIFALLVASPAAAQLGDNEDATSDFLPAFTRFAMLVSVLLLLAQVLELLAQTARVGETDLGGLIGNPAAIGTMLGSNYGLFLKLRLAAALVCVAALMLAYALDWRGWVWLIPLLGGGYYAVEAMSGHSAAAANGAGATLFARLAPYANWLHMIATAAWLGGLAAFVFVVLPRLRAVDSESRRRYLATAVARFSPLALVSVVVLVGSGAVAMFAQNPTLDTLLTTAWGQALLVKSLLLALLVAMGALNLFITRPRLRRLAAGHAEGIAEVSRSFGWLMRGEATIAAAVLVFAAILTLTPPATASSPPAPAMAQVVASPTASTVTTTPTATASPTRLAQTAPLVLTQTVRRVNVTLSLQPSGDGDRFNVALSGPISDVTLVSLRLALLDESGEASSSDAITATAQPAGSYAFPIAPYLTLTGDWQAVLVVRQRDVANDLKAAYRLRVADDGSLSGSVADYINAVIVTDPSPPQVGDVGLTITLSDADGRPIDDAKLTVQCYMPSTSLTAGPVTTVGQGGGRYVGSVKLSAAGGWSVNIVTTRPNGERILSEASFDVVAAAQTATLTPVAP